MNKILILILAIFFLNNCSLNENSRIWKNKEKKLEVKKNIKKVFEEEKITITEFNSDLKINLNKIIINSKNFDNQNNLGSQNYNGKLNKVGTYKFSKLKNIDQLNFKPIFLKDGLIFFDKKGSIIRYDNNQKILWKNNYYSKSEKKLKPKINFILDKDELIILDSLAKYYSININTGKLNWSKNNTYPFNSEIKKIKNKIFVVDYKNTLRCYNIVNGSECWNLQTEDSFTISNSQFSIVIIEDVVIFNNSIGDITAVDIETGLINWQLPTQSSSIINETYNFKTSRLVLDGASIYFSNNKGQFYSIDINTGTINWISKINSNITPTIIKNLIFTVSNNGYLYVIEKNKGDIIRITDIFKNYKINKRKSVEPIGFVIGKTNLYLTNSDGKMIVIDLSLGNIIREEKVSGHFTSKPIIYNKNLFIIRNGSIIKYD